MLNRVDRKTQQSSLIRQKNLQVNLHICIPAVDFPTSGVIIHHEVFSTSSLFTITVFELSRRRVLVRAQTQIYLIDLFYI